MASLLSKHPLEKQATSFWFNETMNFSRSAKKNITEETMLSLQSKEKPIRSAEKIDFKLSDFSALKVPNGWERLYVTIISAETGKTISKLSTSLVRSGKCRWTETLSRSIWVAGDDSSQQIEEEEDDCLFKFIVAMGSARSGILGEATVNMARYASSSSPIPVQLPLKKCNHGTILQLMIHCLTPRTEFINDDSPTEDVKSEESTRNASSYSSKDQNDQIDQRETRSMEESVSSSGLNHSYDSAANSIGRESCFSSSNNNGDEHNLNREDSTSSRIENPSRSNHSSFNSRQMDSDHGFQENQQDLRAFGSSKNLLETAEDAIEELRTEAKKWERIAMKVMLDLEIIRGEYSDQSKKQENLIIELSAVIAERDGLQKEVERLKVLLENSIVNPCSSEDSVFQVEGVKDLEDEIQFQKDSINDLALQLKRSQGSNIELLSILQELEETIEKQKLEIESVKLIEMDSFVQVNEENQNFMLKLQQLQESEQSLLARGQLLELALQEMNNDKDNEESMALMNIETKYRTKLSAKEEEIASLKAKLVESLKESHPSDMDVDVADNVDSLRDIGVMKEKLQMLERDCNDLADENLQLLVKLRELSENNQEKLKKEVEYDALIQEHERLNIELEARVSELREEFNERSCLVQKLEADLELKEEEIGKVMRSQSTLEGKVSDLEKEKARLEENMEAYLSESEIATKCLNDLQNDLMVLSKSVDSHISVNKFLERKSSELENGKLRLELHIADLKQENAYLSDQGNALSSQLEENRTKLEQSNHLVLTLQEEKTKLRNDMETEKMDLKRNLEERNTQLSAAQEECKCLSIEQTKLQSTTQRIIEECIVLKKSNGELKKKNLELQELHSHLEAKLSDLHKNLTDSTKKIKLLEEKLFLALEDGASKEKLLSAELDAVLDENRRFKEELDQSEITFNKMHQEHTAEVENLQQEMECISNKLFAAENERDSVTSKSAHDLSDLRAQLDKICDESQKRKEKLNQSETLFNKKYLEHTAEIENLQQDIENITKKLSGADNERDRLTSNYEQKVSHLQAQLDAVLDENRKQKEKIEQRETLFNQKYLEHITVVENLEQEVEYITDKLSAAENERDIITSKSADEVSRLHAQLDAISNENKKHKDKLVQSETLFNQKYLKHTAEVENLQQEVEYITKKLFEAETELDRITAESEHEVSNLRVQLDILLEENRKHKEKLNESETLLNEKYMEHTAEVGNLQQKVDYISKKLSATEKERDLNTIKSADEVSRLHAQLDVISNDYIRHKEKLDQSETLFNQKYLEHTAEVENLQQELKYIAGKLSAAESERDRISRKSEHQVSDLRSQLDIIIDENRKHKEKHDENEILFNEKYMEHIAEVESLQQEMEYLRKKLSAVENERDRIAIKCEHEVSRLHAQLDSIMDEKIKHKEKLDQSETLFNQKYQEYRAEVEDLQQEVEDISKKLDEAENEKDRITNKCAHEISHLHAELEAILDESRKHKEKLDQSETLFNQKVLESTAEVRNLQTKVEHLTRKLSDAHDERDRISHESEREKSHLLAKMESEFNTMQIESETKVDSLEHELASFKQNLEMLRTENDRLLKLVQKNNYVEDKFNTTVNDLELKLIVYEYERQHLLEESSNLKMKLLTVVHVPDKVLTLTNKLNELKSEKQKLEASLERISVECKELKLEKSSLVEKIGTLQKATTELEDCRKSRVTLEEKLLQMADDLAENQTMYSQDPELIHELSLIKRENEQLQKQIQLLEKENNKSTTKAQALEEKMKEKTNNQMESNLSSSSNRHKRENEDGDSLLKIQSLEEKLDKAQEANKMYKIQLKRLTSEGRKIQTESPKNLTHDGEVVLKERYERTNSSIEAELRELRERYLDMSLKYAEVEAQREELVMKMKTSTDGKKLSA